MFAKTMGSAPDKAKATWLGPVITMINNPKKNLWSIKKQLFVQKIESTTTNVLVSSKKSSASSDKSGEGGADVHAYLTDTKVAAAVTKFSRSFKETVWSAIKKAEKDATACATTTAAKQKLTTRMTKLTKGKVLQLMGDGVEHYVAEIAGEASEEDEKGTGDEGTGDEGDNGDDKDRDRNGNDNNTGDDDEETSNDDGDGNDDEDIDVGDEGDDEDTGDDEDF